MAIDSIASANKHEVSTIPIQKSDLISSDSYIEPEPLITINIDKAITNSGTVSLSEITDSIQYVILKEKEGNFINGKTSVKLSKEFLFIHDSDGIKQFNLDGTFIRKIGNYGKGPQEYLHISDFSIDEANNQIFVLSAQTKKIIVYDFKGQYLKSIYGIDEHTSGIFNLNRNRFLLHRNNSLGTNRYNYYITTNELQVVRQFPNYIKFNSGSFDFVGNYLNYYIYGGLHYVKDMNDTLFYFEPSKELLIPRAVFLSKNSYASNFKGFTMKNLSEIAKIPYYYEICETKSHIFFSFTMNRHRYYCCYNKLSKREYFLNDKMYIKNNIDNMVNFWPEYQLNNQLVMLIQGDNFHDAITGKKASINGKHQKIIDKISEEDWVALIVNLKS